MPITHPVRSQSCSSCKLLSPVRDTTVTVQGVYKKYIWAHADPFIKILAKWEVAFLTSFLRKWILGGGRCLPVPRPSTSNLPAQGQISNPSGQDYSTQTTNSSKCYMETRDLGEPTSFSPMAGKAGSKLNFCQALEKQNRNVLNDKKIETAFINPIQTRSHSPLPGFGHNWIKYRDYSLSEQPTLPQGLFCLSPGSPPHTMPGYHKKGHQLLFSVRSNLSLRVQDLAKHHQPLRQIQWCQKDDRPPPRPHSCYPQSHGETHAGKALKSTAPPWHFFPRSVPTVVTKHGCNKAEQLPLAHHYMMNTETHSHHETLFFYFPVDNPKRVGSNPWIEEVELKHPASTFNRNCLQHLFARKPQLIVLQYQ